MATILLSSQVKVPYATMNVAQINEMLDTYSENETIVEGLTALKEAIISDIDTATDCIQCAHTGIIDDGDNFCPLCGGQTKTPGQYTVEQQLLGYNPPA